MAVRARMKAQRLHDRFVVDRAGKDHVVACRGRHGRMIGITRIDAAEHGQRRAARVA